MADIIQALTARLSNCDLSLGALATKRNITKQLCVCLAVYELLIALLALELAG